MPSGGVRSPDLSRNAVWDAVAVRWKLRPPKNAPDPDDLSHSAPDASVRLSPLRARMHCLVFRFIRHAYSSPIAFYLVHRARFDKYEFQLDIDMEMA